MSKNPGRLLLAIALSTSAWAHAGVYSDDLSRCLVESSTASDKSTFVKWMFTAMALHPDVASMASVSAEQRASANKAAADTFVKLMTETCLSQSKKAIQYEGALAIQQSFMVFGQVAGQQLFANPDVARGLAGLERHVDNEKLTAVLGLPRR